MRKPFLALALFCFVLFLANASALSAPNVSSSSHTDSTEWYNHDTVRMKWDEVEGAVSYYYAMDREPGTEPTTEDDSTNELYASVQKGLSGEWFFHIRAFNGSLGPTAHFKVKLDLRGPDIGVLEAKPTQEGNIGLSWGAATDDVSGVSHYTIYRGAVFDFDIETAGKQYSPLVGTSYVDGNNMEDSKTFFYLLVAIDNAGNQSRVSNRVAATTLAFCDFDVEISANLSGAKDKLLVSLVAGGQLYDATFTATLPGGETQTFFSNSSDISEYDGEIDLGGISEGMIELELSAREKLGDDCSASYSFEYDITNPSVEIIFPALNETLEGAVPVKASAVDNGSYKSGIGSVEFFVREESWISLGEMQALGSGEYSLDWNTFKFSNGRYQLKVVAKDKVGNEATASSGAVLLNTVYQAGDANSAIAQATEAAADAREVINSLKKENVVSSSLEEVFSAAEQDLDSAVDFYGQGGNYYTNASESAAKAIAGFESIESILSVEKVNEQPYVYNSEQASVLFNASPLDKSLVSEAVAMVSEASPGRRLEILRVSENGVTTYRANIVVSFSFYPGYFEDNDLNSLALVEFVPTEFASGPDALYSFYPVELGSQQGQTLVMISADKAAGEAGEVIYGLKADLTEEEANALISNSVVNKFVAPPVLLKGEFAMPSFFLPFPVLDFSFGWVSFDIVIILVAIIVVIAVAVVIGFLLYKREAKKRKKGSLDIFS